MNALVGQLNASRMLAGAQASSRLWDKGERNDEAKHNRKCRSRDGLGHLFRQFGYGGEAVESVRANVGNPA